MRFNPSAIRLAVCAALGVVAVAPAARAAALPNGVYLATINPTPYTTPTGTLIKAGTDGAWNSTFSFNALPTRKSQGMTDNATDLTISGTSYGSSVLGKGAGSWDMTVSGGTFTTSGFQVDAIFTTAGGTFVQYGSITGGTIDQTTGAMILDPTGRMGAVSTVPGAKWNIPATPTGSTAYAQLITGTSTNASGSVTGHDIVSNGDGTYNVILVSASNVGTAWGSGFATVPYVETWNVNLKPLLIANADTASAQPGVAQLIDVEKNDTIGSGVTPTIVLPSSTSTNGATLTVSSGEVSYTASSAGTDTFKYELKDSQGDTTPPATVTVTVASGVTATPDTASTHQGKSVTINVLKNDSGATGATVTIATRPTHGSVVVNGSNQVVYTRTPGFVGTDTFKYTDTVSGKEPSTAKVTVTVNPAFQAGSWKVSRGAMAVTKHSINGYLNYNQVPSPSNSKITKFTKWCIGGCFDFQVTGVLSAPVQVVLLPLTTPIPSASHSPHYWKYFATTKSWKEFVVNSTNSIASAPLNSTGSCPPANAPSYKTGLNSPDKCIQLTITDNGPNDENGTIGTIADPGGVATTVAPGASTTTTDFKGLGSGGCALGTDASPWHGGSWWLIGAVIGWLGFSRRRRSPQRS